MALNFKFSELLYSKTAEERGISNIPDKESANNILELIVLCLQPIRDKLKKPIIITSGYRSPELNKIIGGVNSSQHCKGQAADIKVNGMRADELANFIHNSGVEYDQLIVEYDSWVHISFCKGKNRKMRLIIS
jgi:hypothetical protein